MSTLRAFWELHPDAEQPLKAWYEEATHASWTQPADIKAQYRSEPPRVSWRPFGLSAGR
ncbi:MAG: type II toxin-antitoxin system HigB family toxin [Acidithiobacillus sp.]|uniref:type II toxin-antitoxin system HigB family toxin n=1 Tax=Acidithiobacillus sp. TaxID=1872118 RepID=UPI003560566E